MVRRLRGRSREGDAQPVQDSGRSQVTSEMIRDERRTAVGWPLFLLIALSLGAAIFVWRAIVAGTEDFQLGYPWRMATTLVAALIWVLACAGSLHNGRRMRWVATACWSANIVMAVVGVVIPDLFHQVSPWYQAGATYYYLPTLGAIAGLAWIMWSRPASIAQRNL